MGNPLLHTFSESSNQHETAPMPAHALNADTMHLQYYET